MEIVKFRLSEIWSSLEEKPAHKLHLKIIYFWNKFQSYLFGIPDFIQRSFLLPWLKFNSVPGWSRRANQHRTALFQRFHKFQRWSALFQSCSALVLSKSKSALFSAGSKWFGKSKKNAFCKFGKVLGLQKTCSLGVFQQRKNHFRRNFSQNSNWRTRLLSHAPWLKVTCIKIGF